MRKTESYDQHSFDLLNKSLNDSIAKDKERLGNAKTERAGAASSTAHVQADLAAVLFKVGKDPG